MASGQRSPNIGAELQQIEARIEADRATLKRLEAEAKNERPDLPDPEAITAAVFQLHELMPKDLDRAPHALTRWFKDGQNRVQKEPAGSPSVAPSGTDVVTSSDSGRCCSEPSNWPR